MAVWTLHSEAESAADSCAWGVKQCLLGQMPCERSCLLKVVCLTFAQYLCGFCDEKAMDVCWSGHHTGRVSIPRWWLCFLLKRT